MTGQNGFLRGTLRGFARIRRSDGVGAIPPMLLTGYADGRLVLADPSTGRLVELEAFGSSNEAVFARLLTMAPRAQSASAAPRGF
jgi:putative photosynthetic complex assembly protein